MEYRFLGQTGLRVSNICLGTMSFGPNEARPGQADEPLAHQIMDAFVKAGGNLIDTADCYQRGASETMVGSWLKKQKRDKIILATKVFQVMDPTDPNSRGLSRHHILTNIEESLRRLQTSYIDILYVHCFDHSTPIQETMRVLTDLVSSGKVRYLGASNFTGWQLQLAACTSRQFGLERFVCVEQQYNLLVRETEWEVSEVCRREGISLLPWSPLKGGWLSGQMRRNGPAPGTRIHHVLKRGQVPNQSSPSFDVWAQQDRTWKTLDKCEEIAVKHQKTVPQVAIRWLLQKEIVPSVVLGVETVVQLESNLGCNSFSLSIEEMADLDEVSKITAPYPYEMSNRMNSWRLA